MGIHDLRPEQITCGAKILYYADSCEKFAEYELDYILFAKVAEIAPYKVNTDEVKNNEWVGLRDIDDFLNERLTRHGEGITPWFKLLKDKKLHDWWLEIETSNTFPN